MNLLLRNKIAESGLYSWLNTKDKIPFDQVETTRCVLGHIKHMHQNYILSIKDAYCFWKAYSDYKQSKWLMPIDYDELSGAVDNFMNNELRLKENGIN